MSPPDVDFYFYWFLVVKSVYTLKLYGLIFGRGGGIFAGISEFRLFTKAHGMSENMDGPNNNILI